MANTPPDDTVRRKFSPTVPNPPEAALHLTPRQFAKTIRDGQRSNEGPARTVRDGLGPPAEVMASDPKTGAFNSFQGRKVQSFLSSSGSEADILILAEGPGEFRILRLYRQGRIPKPEVFQRLVKLSKDMNGLAVRTLETGFDQQSGRWYEIQEYLPGGDLATLLCKGPLNHDDLTSLVTEMAEALARLHGQDIIHRDIKPENILIRSLSPLKIALSDFGISSLLAPDISIKETNMANTPLYSAPESFGSIVGKAADWWSLGAVILEALTGHHPLENLTFNEVMREITTRGIRVPDTVPPAESLLIKGLLTRNDKKRWRYHEVTGWLMGQRDIEVHYEAPESLGPMNIAYILDGQEFQTPEELASVFASSEEQWDKGREHLARGYIRQWLEKQGKFDQAIHTEVRGQTSPDVALFNFIQIFCPQAGHIWRGQLLSFNNISYYLTNKNNLSPHSKLILKEILEVKLRDLVSIAKTNKLPFDDKLSAILSFGHPISAETLAAAMAASQDPEAYIWGHGGAPNRPATAIKFVLQTGTPLVEKAFLTANVPANAVIPRDLFLGGFNEASTYKLGVDRLLRLIREGIFKTARLHRHQTVPIPQIGPTKVSPLTTEEIVQYYNWCSLDPQTQALENFVAIRAIDGLENRTVGAKFKKIFHPYFFLAALVTVLLLVIPVVWFLDGLNLVTLDAYGIAADQIVKYREYQQVVYILAGALVAGLILVFVFYRQSHIFLTMVLLAAGGFALYKNNINPKSYFHYITWVVHGGFLVICLYLINCVRKLIFHPKRINNQPN
jgi:serine/threonine protein kinase